MFVKSKIYTIFYIWLVLLFNNIKADVNIDQKAYSIVFVYLEDNLPAYLEHSTFQARTFNKDCNIFLLTNASAVKKNEQLINKLKNYQVIIVKCEDLIKSDWHKEFDNIYAQRVKVDSGKFRTEQYFYVDELVRQYYLKDVFKVECDVMIYANLENYLEVLHNYYSNGIACPFQNDYIANVSFIYFSNSEAIQKFIKFVSWVQRGQILEFDMYLLASYKNHTTGKEIDYLPTISKDIIRRSILKNQRGEIASKPWKYWNYIEYWDSIFDNGGIGSFLEDGRWTFDQAFFDASFYKFLWEKDSEGRLVPYMCLEKARSNFYLCAPLCYEMLKYRINTLHIVSKNLEKYLSINKMA